MKQRKSKFVFLFWSLLLILFLYPYFEGYQSYAEELLRMFFILILFSAVYALGDTRQHLVVAIFLGLPVLALNIMGLFTPEPLANPPRLFLFVVFNVFTITIVLNAVLKEAKVTKDTLYGAVTVYLLMGVTWAIGYAFIEMVFPGSFFIEATHNLDAQLTWTDFVYFSFTTLTTLGYGDMAPISSQARSLASLEAITGTLYLVIMIARLVSMYNVKKFN